MPFGCQKQVLFYLHESWRRRQGRNIVAFFSFLELGGFVAWKKYPSMHTSVLIVEWGFWKAVKCNFSFRAQKDGFLCGLVKLSLIPLYLLLPVLESWMRWNTYSCLVFEDFFGDNVVFLQNGQLPARSSRVWAVFVFLCVHTDKY